MRYILKEALTRASEDDLLSIIQKLSDGEEIVNGNYVSNQSNTNMEQLAGFIGYSANVLFNISSRLSDEESFDLVTSYSKLVDKFLNASLDVLRLSHQKDNSSLK